MINLHKVWDGMGIELATPGSAVKHILPTGLRGAIVSQEKIFKIFVISISHAPWRPCVLTDQICLAIFVEGHLLTISAKKKNQF